MKKLSLLLIILLIPPVFAISSDIRESYAPGETLIAEISGNILEPIDKEKVELKRNNVQVPWEYDLKRLGDRYFLYGILPDEENAYTLHIKDIVTTVNGRVTELDFNQTFSTQGELAQYNIKPGFAILQASTKFNIFLNRDANEPISVSFPEERTFVLKPGQNTLKIVNPQTDSGLIIMQVGTYSVPLLVISEEIEETIPLPQLRFFPRNIKSVILLDQPVVFPINIVNDGETEITEVFLEFDEGLFLIEPPIPETIAPNETLKFNLTLLNQNSRVEETIFLRSGDFFIEFPINIDYTENINEVQTPYLEENYSESLSYYCQELGGSVCTAEETCSTDTVSSLDTQSCCIGACSTPSTSTTSYAWLGWLIGILVLLVLIGLVLRYRKKKKLQPDMLKKRTESPISPISPISEKPTPDKRNPTSEKMP